MTPKRVLIVAILFILCGAQAVWSIVEAALHSRLNINLGVFLLFVGMGLLRGKRSSLSWARFWIVLGYILIVVAAGLFLSHPSRLKISLWGEQVHGASVIPYALVILAGLAAALIACHRALNSPKSLAYFGA